MNDYIFDRKLSIADLGILEKVKAEYFGDESFPIQINVNIEGQQLDENKNFVIGCRAGPSCEISNLLHEMCHFAEREPEKLRKKPHSSWGYKFGKFWRVLGQSGYEPMTDQSVRRELRIWAYQINLEKYFGTNTTIEELVASAPYINAFCLYNSYKDKERKEFRSEAERLVIAEAEVKGLSETTFTLKAFNEAWWHRINLLKKKRRH